MAPQSVLIIQTSYIGDAILATSVIEKLHEYYKNSRLEILVRKGHEELFDDHPLIYQTHTWDKKKKYHDLYRLIRQLRKNHYDLIVNLHRFASSGVITALCRANQKLGFKKNPLSFLYNQKFDHVIGDNTHEIERNHQLIEHLTDKQPAAPKLYPKASEIDKNEQYFCIAPSSVWLTKALPEEKWIDLIDKLPEDHQVYLIGGSKDYSYCEKIQSAVKRKDTINRCGKDQLLATASLMKNATMNYVNDSAPVHIASAVNARITVFFCSTLPSFGFTPWCDEYYIHEINEPLNCRPCGIHGKKICPEGHFKCGHNILLENVPYYKNH